MADPATYVVHLVAAGSPVVAAACGDWRHATNWTTVPAAVTCAECLEKLLARERHERRLSPSPPV